VSLKKRDQGHQQQEMKIKMQNYVKLCVKSSAVISIAERVNIEKFGKS
jgi:hypothetical protein